MNDTILEVMELVDRISPAEPGTTGNLFVLEYKCGFEPNGLASETWENYWVLRFPQIPAFWKSTKDWVRCINGLEMEFKGETMRSVAMKAIEFLLWYLENVCEKKSYSG